MFLYPAFISMPGSSEWLIIFLVILIIFGPKSLPKIGHAIGKGIREFKDASDGITRTIEEEVRASERTESKPKPAYDQEEYVTSANYDETTGGAAQPAETPAAESVEAGVAGPSAENVEDAPVRD